MKFPVRYYDSWTHTELMKSCIQMQVPQDSGVFKTIAFHVRQEYRITHPHIKAEEIDSEADAYVLPKSNRAERFDEIREMIKAKSSVQECLDGVGHTNVLQDVRYVVRSYVLERDLKREFEFDWGMLLRKLGDRCIVNCVNNFPQMSPLAPPNVGEQVFYQCAEEDYMLARYGVPYDPTKQGGPVKVTRVMDEPNEEWSSPKSNKSRGRKKRPAGKSSPRFSGSIPMSSQSFWQRANVDNDDYNEWFDEEFM